jgi:hypothetical protein
MRPALRLLGWVLLGAPLLAQNLPDAEPVSDEVAREAVRTFAGAYKDKDPNIRLSAVGALTRLRHADVAKALGRTLADSDPRVAEAGALRLGLQDRKTAAPMLRNHFAAMRPGAPVPVQVAVLASLRRLESVPPFADLTSRFEGAPIEVQREIIRALAFHRDMKTVEWLAPHLDFPAPANKDDPLNPPAEYWKARVESWKFWIRDLHDVLVDLTGQDFEESAQVKEWRKKGGKLRPLPKEKGPG